MTDLSRTIAPKSDQLNADDLIGRTLDITVSRVSLMTEPDQPIAINFEGDGGKPYKPCKSMRRVMVTVWGSDGNAYAGRRMRLYRDDKVLFGGVAVGGIRISHMSDITRDFTMALTATKASRKPYTVKPLPREEPRQEPGASAATGLIKAGDEAAAQGMVPLGMWWGGLKPAEKKAAGGVERLAAWKAAAAIVDDEEDVPFDSAPPPQSDKDAQLARIERQG